MRYLVPGGRVTGEDCARMAAAFVRYRCDSRQAGQLYAAWRDGWRVVRERILAGPELFLKTQRQPPATVPVTAGLEHDLEMAVAILRRAGRRLVEALPEMDGRRHEQPQGQIESARREPDRMPARIAQEKAAQPVPPAPQTPAP